MSPRRAVWYAFVAELNQEVSSEPFVVKRNPAAKDESPCAYVGYLWNEKPESRYPDGDFSSSNNPMLDGNGRRVLTEYTSRHTHKVGCLRTQEKLIEELRDEGWSVVNPPAPETFHVYVIKLTTDVAEIARVQRSNPDRDPALPCVYVGQTSTSPETRLAQHTEGGALAARHLNGDTVVKLLSEIYGHLNPSTELQSLYNERALAATLRRKGWTVLGGH